MLRCKVEPFFGADLSSRAGFEEFGSLLVRCRDRFLRELTLMVGVGWICERISVWSFLVQDCRNVSHRPWWTCPVALGSWGSGGRCLRANPLRRRGTAETVQRGSLWVHALRGCVNTGRLLPVALTSSFRRQGGVPDYLFLGSFVLRSGRLSSPRPFVGCVLIPSRVHLWIRQRCICSGEPGSLVLFFGAGPGLLSRHRPRVCSSEWAPGRLFHQPFALRSGRVV